MLDLGTKIIQETQKEITVPVALSTLESMQKRLQKAEELNEKMLTVILEQSQHIRYLEALNRVKR